MTRDGNWFIRNCDSCNSQNDTFTTCSSSLSWAQPFESELIPPFLHTPNTELVTSIKKFMSECGAGWTSLFECGSKHSNNCSKRLLRFSCFSFSSTSTWGISQPKLPLLYVSNTCGSLDRAAAGRGSKWNRTPRFLAAFSRTWEKKTIFQRFFKYRKAWRTASRGVAPSETPIFRQSFKWFSFCFSSAQEPSSTPGCISAQPLCVFATSCNALHMVWYRPDWFDWK